jgi:cytochrome c556
MGLMLCPPIRPDAEILSKRGSSQMMRAIFAMTAIAVGVTISVAQSDPIAQRKELMKGNNEGARNASRMVRGEEPFEVAKVNAAFAQWTETAQKLPGLFPEPPKPGQDTRALPKIWENKADFEAKIAAFSKAVAENKDKAKTLDELKVAFPIVTNACNDCHEPYPRPQQR